MRKRDSLDSTNHQPHRSQRHRIQPHRSQRQRIQPHRSQSKRFKIMTSHWLMTSPIRTKMVRTLKKWTKNNPLLSAGGFSLWEADNFKIFSNFYLRQIIFRYVTLISKISLINNLHPFKRYLLVFWLKEIIYNNHLIEFKTFLKIGLCII